MEVGFLFRLHVLTMVYSLILYTLVAEQLLEGEIFVPPALKKHAM
jgi:hypothetical protein